MKYKGYDIEYAKPTGGKAGRGRNQSTTIQVREPAGGDGGGYLLKKSYRCKGGNLSKLAAIAKAKEFIDKLAEEAAEKADAAKLADNKRVRVTLEISQSFLRLLRANIEMTKAVRGWLFNNDDAGDITPSQVLGLLVYMEARGGTTEQIAASTPFMWRPDIDVIHDERRVYLGSKLMSGPRFHGETQHCEKHKVDFETAKCPICEFPPKGG